LALVVHAFAANVFVAVILRPRLLRFLQLPTDAMTTHVRQNRAEPVIEHPRLELKADPEPDRLIAHARNQRQRVVAAHEAALEEIDLPPRAEDLVVQIDGLRAQFFIGDDDDGVGLRAEFYRGAR